MKQSPETKKFKAKSKEANASVWISAPNSVEGQRILTHNHIPLTHDLHRIFISSTKTIFRRSKDGGDLHSGHQNYEAYVVKDSFILYSELLGPRFMQFHVSHFRIWGVCHSSYILLLCHPLVSAPLGNSCTSFFLVVVQHNHRTSFLVLKHTTTDYYGTSLG